MSRKSRIFRVLLLGLAIGLGAGTAAARPSVCVDTCGSWGCRVCSVFCSSIDCYVGCMGAFPSC